ncbi:hypothetical protein [Paracidovorax wautersii]|uniref:hypothetical protein n=1 Tax=Paracidovorax wautersii TaxID=1177982 RepID=UPI000B828C7E|nr:hypothetical protein [Paracidovorax wautersii]
MPDFSSRADEQVLALLRYQRKPCDAYVLARMMELGPMAVGQALSRLEAAGELKTKDELGSVNELAAQFSPVRS